MQPFESRFVPVSIPNPSSILSESSLRSLHESFSSSLKEYLKNVNTNGIKDALNIKIYTGLTGMFHG